MDVSAQHMIGLRIVSCFTTSLTCVFPVFPTGALIIISVSLFISYKILSVFGSVIHLY